MNAEIFFLTSVPADRPSLNSFFHDTPCDNLVGGALASFDKYQGRGTIGEHSVFDGAIRYTVKLH
jgi:hypothetical protein